jgi:CubicO group peptidase (beta-lactamase class C family)
MCRLHLIAARSLFSFLGIILVVSPAWAAAEQVDRFIREYIAKKQIPGVALLVCSEGKTLLAHGYGVANLEHRVPVKPGTVIQSGSTGKQFTAMAVLMLVEEGKLDLDDPVRKHLSVPAAWQRITVRHLLTHTSGLGDYPKDFSLQKNHTTDELWQMITAQALAFEPGEKWSYSNLGYVTLGILVQQVSGKFYGDVLTERIFNPLGMKRTRIINEREIIADRAAGYMMRNGVLTNQDWVAPSVNTTADGSLYFTIEDLAKWDEALETRRLISKPMYDLMWTPVRLNDGQAANYGFGWTLRTEPNGRRVIEHGGAWQGFSAYIGRYPGEKLTVVALANLAGADVSYIARVVAGLYRPDLAPVRHQAIPLPLAVLQACAGTYRLDDRVTITVSMENGRLSTTFLGQKRDLIPKSDSEFFEEDSDRTYTFRRGENGGVIALTITVPEKLVFVRLR